MKNALLLSAAILSLGISVSGPAKAQAEPDFSTAVNLLNLFQKQCLNTFPDFSAIRAQAIRDNWVVGPLAGRKPVSWAVNEGADNFSLMIVDSPAASTQKCEVWGKASEVTTVGVFNGLYKENFKAYRTNAPENSWNTPNGLITIQQANDERTAVILTK